MLAVIHCRTVKKERKKKKKKQKHAAVGAEDDDQRVQGPVNYYVLGCTSFLFRIRY